MDLGPHATFIIASYASAGLILTILIGWIVLENRALKRTLAELESRGIRRRSDERTVETTRKSAAHSLA